MYLMKKVTRRVFAILLVAVLVFGIAPLSASANTAAQLAAQLNAISGISASDSGDIVTVTGTNTSVSTPLALNLNPEVTINWQATYTGTVSPASASMMTISGSGTFNVESDGTIMNIGTGNTLNITGSGTTLSVGSGGSIMSERSGSTVLLNGNNITVNVGDGGSIISMDGNANAALQIGGGAAILGTKVNVDGGSVISVGAGFAINDGAGTALVNNDTEIKINSGAVTAGGNSAVHSTGIRSTVVVSGGVVSNAAGNNLNPTIDMQGDMTGGTPGNNITISGSALVQSTSTNGYTVQTKGNVLIEENAHVVAINGRAVNLVGLDSVARVTGGLVETMGNGTAISTATTNVETVVRASIEVTGGTVRSVNGYALNITGTDSKVTVSGGDVSTTSATYHTINASGTNATIAVSGHAVVSATATDAVRTTATNAAAVSVSGNAKVSSITGRAIQANGTGAGISITGMTQVWVLNDGHAINCTGGTVTLTGGFMFAYGTNALNVIHAHSTVVIPPAYPTYPYGALVVVWDIAKGVRIYQQGNMGQTSHPDLDVKISGGNNQFHWYNHPTLGGGINYVYGLNVGFFQIPEVTIYGDHGLIFYSETGKMYRNVNGNPILSGVASPAFSPPNDQEFTYLRQGYVFGTYRWSAAPGVLRLYGFSWVTNTATSAPYGPLDSLTIIGDTLIEIHGESRFEAAHPSATGIKFGAGALPGNENVEFTGDSTLMAVGRNSPGIGINIGDGELTVGGGTFIAQAGRAINWVDPPTGRVVADPNVFDYTWTSSKNFDGSNGRTGYGRDEPFELDSTDLFVRLMTVTPINLISAEQVGGISRIADSVAIMLTFSGEVSGLTADNITITNKTGEAVKGILSGSGDTWILTLNSVDIEGLVSIQVDPHVEDFFIDNNEQDDVQIFKADPNQFDLTLIKRVAPDGDFEKLFEFEFLLASDPRAPRAVHLTTDPDDTEAYYVTYINGAPLPPGRITGDDNSVLLLKHNESVKIHAVSIESYFVQEHANVGFITAFNINDEGFFTAPEGISRIFRVSLDTTVECYSSVIPETPGEPERPFEPEDPQPSPRPPVSPRPPTSNRPSASPDPNDPQVLGSVKSPQTGDSRNHIMPIAMLIFGILILAGAEVYRRKTKKD